MANRGNADNGDRNVLTSDGDVRFLRLSATTGDSVGAAPDGIFMPKQFTDPEAVAEDIIRDVGTNLVVGLPLGLGKANHIINALYARAVADPGINLTFFSALTLEKPKPSNLLERRFITPVIDRLFGGYPDLAYADALHAGALPPNIQVIEFFFLAGKWLHVA